MKPLQYMYIMIIMVLTVIVFSSPTFAKGGGYHAPKLSRECKIKILADSAVALQKSNPDLAKALKKMEEEERRGPGILGKLLGME